MPAGYAHEEWVIVPARGRSGLLCPLAMLMKEWVIVPAGYARGGVGYCARWLC